MNLIRQFHYLFILRSKATSLIQGRTATHPAAPAERRARIREHSDRYSSVVDSAIRTSGITSSTSFLNSAVILKYFEILVIQLIFSSSSSAGLALFSIFY